jgi:hypothetical protein
MVVVMHQVAVLWRDRDDGEFGKKGDGHMKATLDGFRVVLAAASFEDVQRELAKHYKRRAVHIGRPKAASAK